MKENEGNQQDSKFDSIIQDTKSCTCEHQVASLITENTALKHQLQDQLLQIQILESEKLAFETHYSNHVPLSVVQSLNDTITTLRNEIEEMRNDSLSNSSSSLLCRLARKPSLVIPPRGSSTINLSPESIESNGTLERELLKKRAVVVHSSEVDSKSSCLFCISFLEYELKWVSFSRTTEGESTIGRAV
jgi:hypothetical protein